MHCWPGLGCSTRCWLSLAACCTKHRLPCRQGQEVLYSPLAGAALPPIASTPTPCLLCCVEPSAAVLASRSCLLHVCSSQQNLALQHSTWQGPQADGACQGLAWLCCGADCASRSRSVSRTNPNVLVNLCASAELANWDSQIQHYHSSACCMHSALCTAALTQCAHGALCTAALTQCAHGACGSLELRRTGKILLVAPLPSLDTSTRTMSLPPPLQAYPLSVISPSYLLNTCCCDGSQMADTTGISWMAGAADQSRLSLREQ